MKLQGAQNSGSIGVGVPDPTKIPHSVPTKPQNKHLSNLKKGD